MTAVYTFLLTPNASVDNGSGFEHTPSEVLYGWASPPPPPTYSPGAVVEREFTPQQAYAYALAARLDRGAEEFYVAVKVGDCVLVDKCDAGWTLVTHESGIQGWIPATCVGR